MLPKRSDLLILNIFIMLQIKNTYNNPLTLRERQWIRNISRQIKSETFKYVCKNRYCSKYALDLAKEIAADTGETIIPLIVRGRYEDECNFHGRKAATIYALDSIGKPIAYFIFLQKAINKRNAKSKWFIDTDEGSIYRI